MAPGTLQTDNGTEFANWILRALCSMYGIRFIQGSVGHPQSQVGSHGRRNRPGCDAACNTGWHAWALSLWLAGMGPQSLAALVM